MEKEGRGFRMYIPYLEVIEIARHSAITREQPLLANTASRPSPEVPQISQVDVPRRLPPLIPSSNVCPTTSPASFVTEQQPPLGDNLAQKLTTHSSHVLATERRSIQLHAATGYEEQFTY